LYGQSLDGNTSYEEISKKTDRLLAVNIQPTHPKKIFPVRFSYRKKNFGEKHFIIKRFISIVILTILLSVPFSSLANITSSIHPDRNATMQNPIGTHCKNEGNCSKTPEMNLDENRSDKKMPSDSTSKHEKTPVIFESNTSMVNTTQASTTDLTLYDNLTTLEGIARADHVDRRATSIEVIKVEHFDQNKTFLANITDDVIARDGAWSPPIYHGEYVRVEFESALNSTSDITIVARSQGKSAIEVYTKDNTTLLTTFQNITTEHRYQVFLTNLTDSQLIFDLRTSGDPVEYDYIVDPTTGWVSPTGYADPTGQWSTETNAYDDNTGSYAAHSGAVGWRGYLQLNLSSAIYCDRVRVYSDFDTYYVDKVSIDIYNSTSWIEKYNGTISDSAWSEIEFSGETTVTKARFRYHYIRGSVFFWFYEFDFWQGKPHTLPNGNTLNATSVDETTAVLKGNVSDDGGEPCEYRFQYGVDTSYGTNTSWGGSEPQNAEFGTMIHNLTLGNTYQYRVQLRNDIGTINGSNKNFTTALPSFGWVTPTSHYDPNSKWNYEINSYDDETNTCAQSNHAIGTPQWGYFIYMNHSLLICDKVRFYARGPTADAAKVDQIDLDVKRGGVWVDVFNGTFSDKQWVEKKFTQGSVTSTRIRFHMNSVSSGLYFELYELDFNKSRPVPMLINEGPTNRSWGIILRPQMNITVSNPDGASMTISWSSNSSGSWQLFGTNSSVGNGTYHQRNNNFSNNNTKYWWKVLVTDGIDSNSSWYYFSTADLIKPSSNVNTITPYWKKSTSTITATASDTGWSGLKNVTLYYRFSGDNSSWGGWVSAGADSSAPWSWSFTFPNATGYYQFYSIAVDNATNAEVPPGSADARCGYETLLPSSSVSAITSYWKTSSPQLLSGVASESGPSGLKNVTLRYRYRVSNTSSWGGWVTSGLVDTDPWVAVSWSFTFSNGSGLYGFYSIANDNATNAEAAPGSADASCGFDNQAPTSSLADGSISDSAGSTFEWNGAEGRHPAIIRLGSSEYYLIAAEGDLGGGGSTYDGWLFTIRVWSNNGTIQKSLINSWEYDASDGFYPSICLVNGSSNIYAITYEDAGSTARKVITTRVWSNNGTIQKTILDTLSLYRSTTTSYSKILNVRGNIYAVAYVNNSDGDGRIATCYITNSGDIGNAVNDTLEFNSSDALNPQMCLVDNNTIALVYDGGTAGGNDGYLTTYNISSTGDITNTWADQWEYDPTMGTTPNIYKVWDDSESSGVNFFVIGYEDTNSDLYVKTCIIDDAGKITKSWADTQAIDITNGDYCSFASVGYNSSFTTKLMLCGFSGEGSDGYVSSFDVTNAGAINSEIDTFEFDAADCMSRLWLVKTNTTCVWMVVYEGTGNDGWSGTFTVTTNGVPYWKTSSPFTILGTGSDSGPAGLKNITLWYRYRVANISSWGGWLRWSNAGNPDVDPWAGISWSFTFPNGTGFYQFYSIARDNVSNTESAPVSADFWCGYDIQAPMSSVNAIPTPWTSASSLIVNATASDVGSGVKNVTLYYRFSGNNASWSGWMNAGTDTASPWSWSFSFSNGTGYYQFYSIAKDNLTYVESAPGSADAFCGYDTIAPTSSVNAVSPYWLRTSPLTILAIASDALSGVKNVTLYYRFSSNNASWGGYVNVDVDTAAPWSWSFSYSNGTGYYQFYTIAKDNAANFESAPGSADTLCGYDNVAPMSSLNLIVPYWKVTWPLSVSATASDALSGVKNVTLYYRFSNDNGSWGGWMSADVDSALPWNWGFGFTNGSGYYQFYSIAKDNATNTEAAPWTADASCGYDILTPSSSVDAISPYWKQSAATISATASDTLSGVKNVTLYYRYSINNGSWGGWVSAGVDTTSPWNWSFTFLNGSGYYQFYSIAHDNVSNTEADPGSADAWCGYDTTAPSSFVDAITPYWKNAIAMITATTSDTFSGVKNVTLYYRFSSDNASWDGWVSTGVDIAAPWSWSFSFSNGSGYYKWYSIAKDNATNVEAAPGGSDSWCGYETLIPSSSIDIISSYWKTSSPLTITASANDSGMSGLRNVTLYYRYREANASSWGSYVSFGVDSDPWSTCSWDFAFQNGSGHYEFYSIAVDNATNTEAAPGVNGDAECGFSNGVPFSQVNTISPYWTSVTPLSINATADDNGPSGLQTVTLYYYHSLDNMTWSGPWDFGSDDDPWITCGWDFTFPNETGWYRFYSIALDNSSSKESPPLVNDSYCGFDDQSPTCSITYNRSATFFKSNDSVRINANFSEIHSGISESSVLIRIETMGDGDLANHSMTMIDDTHGYYDWIIPDGSDDDGVFTVSLYANDRVNNLLSPYPTVDSSKEIDNTPPSISFVSVGDINSSAAIVDWETNEVASTMVEYGHTSSDGYDSSIPGYVTLHSCVLTGLSSYSTYHYRVVSYDLAGNRNVSSDYTFVTAREPPRSKTITYTGQNNPPSAPTIDGPITGRQVTEYTYKVQSIDFDNDAINYTFDWGDTVIESSGFIPNGTTCLWNHRWMNAGKYILRVTASDNQSSSWSEEIIWIDALPLEDLGYLLDTNSDGFFDAFHNNASGNETIVEIKDGLYLIDSDGNHVWDHEYNATTGVLALRYQFNFIDEKQPLFPWLWVIGMSLFLFAVLIVIFYLRRLIHKSNKK